MAQIYSELRATVDHVAHNPSFYDAELDIRGDFREHAAELATLGKAAGASS